MWNDAVHSPGSSWSCLIDHVHHVAGSSLVLNVCSLTLLGSLQYRPHAVGQVGAFPGVPKLIALGASLLPGVACIPNITTVRMNFANVGKYAGMKR